MRIQPLSDLHIEMRNNYTLEQTDAEVIVLAGDISVGIEGVEFAGRESARLNKPIIYVAGNHEYYSNDYPTTLTAMRQEATNHPLVYFLENDEVIIKGTRFLGATLWTDYEGDGGNRSFNMMYAQQRMNDHHVISNNNKRFSPSDALAIHEVSKAWLQEKLAFPFEGKTVVVTHHGPSMKCQHPDFRVGALSTAFQSAMDDLVTQADAWIYGHTHANLDIKIGRCRLISNQLGYPGELTPPDGLQNTWIELCQK